MTNRINSVALAFALLLGSQSVPVHAEENPTAPSEVGIIDKVEINVTAPLAGTKNSAAKPSLTINSEHCEITDVDWLISLNMYTSGVPEWTFEKGETYYIYAMIKAEDGYEFAKGSEKAGGIDEGFVLFDGCTVNGGKVEFAGSMTFNSTNYNGNYLRVKISVEAVADSSFFGVLISDVDNNVNSGGGYILDYPGNEFGSEVKKTATNNFVENGSQVRISAIPDDGYYFVGWYQGQPDGDPGHPFYTGEAIETDNDYFFDAPISLDNPHVCAVFDKLPENAPTPDQIQVWSGNYNDPSADRHGLVAVKYTPREPNIYHLKTMDGTNFTIGEIVQFYHDDEITAIAQPKEGYVFKGWYHVNIEWGPNETLAYEGDVISTETTFTYKPAVTIVDGDTEPLRYVCAVFDVKPEVEEFTITFDANGGTGTMANVNAEKDTAFALPECTFTAPEGKEFDKWDKGAVGTQITITADLTVKAEWKDIQQAEEKACYAMAEENAEWKKGSTTPLTFTVNRSIENETAITHFYGIEIDDGSVPNGSYEATSGSVKLTLNAEYLETLAVGKHSLKAVFDDGEANATFTIIAADEPKPTQSPTPTATPKPNNEQKPTPSTSDHNNPLVWLVLLASSVVAVILLGKKRFNK